MPPSFSTGLAQVVKGPVSRAANVQVFFLLFLLGRIIYVVSDVYLLLVNCGRVASLPLISYWLLISLPILTRVRQT